jgi:hypothetical protein
MISPKLLDFLPFFLLISSPLGTADFLVLLELSGDGYSLLCSKKQPPRHSHSMHIKVTVHTKKVKFQLTFPPSPFQTNVVSDSMNIKVIVHPKKVQLQVTFLPFCFKLMW